MPSIGCPARLLPGLGGGPGVELRHGVRVARMAQHEGGHVERRVRLVGVAAAELEQLVGLHARGGEPRLQRGRDEVTREHLVAGRHGRVDREDGVATDATERLAGSEARIGGQRARERARAAGTRSGPR